ncbi:MAG TPA: Asp-tRNA(Asn)/Glu-tRNA(Gln) amidotransferase subunit GatB [Candidatus Saccharibacteria bacterium]|nr:Asp-tRNA(Asn)/Glu-tRNA(Gln) amidotransferase subunit GatB [Candidatus Saccharibacteria bacterium]
MISDEILKKYDLTVGIECHVQLATETKLFSGADNDADDKDPNIVVSPIDFALPGMLPVLNRKAVDLAIIAGRALNSKIASISRFDRKHYFYPDLPKGYQISQMYQPIIGSGVVYVPREDGSSFDVHINHAHMEEDAGKLTHHGEYSLVDLNRAGTPLIEIVSEPDIHSSADAKAYVTELYHLMTHSGVTKGDLYHGNMRFDVNVSISLKGSNSLGTRAEIKNLNSFRSVERSVDYEYRRQASLLEKGEKITQETRGWDEAKQKTFSQRSKEEAQDYRYMPDPDIPPIYLTDEEISKVQANIPILPFEWRKILADLGLDYAQIETLLFAENEYKKKISLLDEVKRYYEKGEIDIAKHLANWRINMLIPILREESFKFNKNNNLKIEIDIYSLLKENKLSSTNAKILFREIIVMDELPNVEKYAEDNGYLQVSDDSFIIDVVDDVLNDPCCQKAVNDFKNGNEKVIGFLVGQIMKKSSGKANPALAQKILRERI